MTTTQREQRRGPGRSVAEWHFTASAVPLVLQSYRPEPVVVEIARDSFLGGEP